MSAFYNEHDPAAAAWLRELIKARLIAPGEVDESDIQKLRSKDLGRYTQVHLFAGIGGWSYALRLAGWPDDRPVWTGSCPCQPFSAAGKQKGTKDARHLWPWMRYFMFRWRPPIAFGEQVASAIGREWLAGVRANLETLGYGVGAADLCAAGIAAPHIRQRLFWVADTGYGFREGRGQRRRMEASEWGKQIIDTGAGGMACGLADAQNDGRRIDQPQRESEGRIAHGRAGSGSGFWSDFDLVPCRDGKTRRIESGSFPLAHGIPGRVGLLRGYGNAIVAQLAAKFIQAYYESRGG